MQGRVICILFAKWLNYDIEKWAQSRKHLFPSFFSVFGVSAKKLQVTNLFYLPGSKGFGSERQCCQALSGCCFALI